MPLTKEDLSAAPFSQAHLFEGLSSDQVTALLDQLNTIDGKLPGGGLKGYIERGRALLQGAKEGQNPFEGLNPEVPKGEKLFGETGPGSETFASFERIGMGEISKCCFCLVAGGLGERLGYPGIKIGIRAEVTTGATFMATYCKFILAFQDYARQTTGDSNLELPFAIMTSGDTHEKTLELLKANNNFGMAEGQVTLLKQELVPALKDIDARISIKDGVVETKPHGHGDVHALLHQRGLPAKWIKEGRKWMLLFQDTNPLPFRCLCAVLGVSEKNNFVMNSVAVPRNPKEAIGAICTLKDASGSSNLTVNVEYNQLEPLLKATPVGGDVADDSGYSPYPGNINVLLFGLEGLNSCLEKTGGIVPEFVNPKWADEEKSKLKSATRLECMMQDFPRLCDSTQKVGFSQLDRWMSFTCVKNNLADAAKKTPPDCSLSAEADIYASNAKLLALAGPEVQIGEPKDISFLGITAKIGARIVLEPSFGISLEQMKERVKGPVKISSTSSLILDGVVTLESLDLDGALSIQGPVTVKDKVVKNEGTILEAIPDEELSSVEPSLQIRGYRLSKGTVETLGSKL